MSGRPDGLYYGLDFAIGQFLPNGALTLSLQYEYLEKHLAVDYPEYLSIARKVEDEVRQFEKEISDSIRNTPESDKTPTWIQGIRSRREYEKEKLNQELAESSQRVSDIIAAIDLDRYETVCDCCPKESSS